MAVNTQTLTRTVYSRRARTYDFFVHRLTMGVESRLRHRLLGRLALRPGDTVLDLACGTGLNFDAIEEAIGPSGQLIGVDLTPAMLTEARNKVTACGWANVTLIEADATAFQATEPVDVALCTLAIGLMPDPDAAVWAMVGMVRLGGRVLIGDGRLANRWYGPLLNPPLRWVSDPWIPAAMRERYWRARPWETLQALTEDFHCEEWLGGTVYIAWGRRSIEKLSSQVRWNR
ncbi:MAG: class I SAM-dependent methyltransferase [Anaerolineae bacterium]